MTFLHSRNQIGNDPFFNKKYNQIFTDWYSPLCNYCFGLTGNRAVSEDIVQDLFILVWEDWGRFEKMDGLKAYLFSAARNRCINYFKQNKQPDFSLDTVTGDWLIKDNLPSAVEMLEWNELQSLIDQAVAQLPDRCRTIFLLKRIDEMTNKEIADQLSISLKTVEAQMTIALKRLYQFVSEHWELLVVVFLFSAV